MATNKYAVLSSALKGFEEASTRSQSPGYVQAGKYLIQDFNKDHKKNFPDNDTDYACIQVPAFGSEDTWICTRWKDREYAKIIEETTASLELLNFDNQEDAIEEKALIDLLPKFHDFEYDLDEAKYPYDLPGFRAPQAPPLVNNCCTFVEALVVKAWDESSNDLEWNMERHKQMMIYSADDYFSPVTALVEAGIAEAVADDDQAPSPWTVIQGWRKQWTSGHTFIIVEHHPGTDRVLTLESNAHYNLNGVGYRKVGNLKDHPQPDPSWWDNETLWTWERIKAVYRFHKQCILKVKNRNWA